MLSRLAVAAVAAFTCLGASNAWATETTMTTEPGEPTAQVAPMPPGTTGDCGDEGSMDVVLDLGGIGTDSRSGAVPADALEVRWRFAVVGAPPGTPLHVWARFAGARR